MMWINEWFSGLVGSNSCWSSCLQTEPFNLPQRKKRQSEVSSTKKNLTDYLNGLMLCNQWCDKIDQTWYVQATRDKLTKKRWRSFRFNFDWNINFKIFLENNKYCYHRPVVVCGYSHWFQRRKILSLRINPLSDIWLFAQTQTHYLSLQRKNILFLYCVGATVSVEKTKHKISATTNIYESFWEIWKANANKREIHQGKTVLFIIK